MSVLTHALTHDDLRALTDLLQQHRQARLDQIAGLTLSAHRDPRALALARAAVDDLADAFGRLADGSYGWCLRCTASIPPERLYVAPAARYCSECSC
jgi:RNA polymerase-binding transcription factor DksA